MLDFLAQVQNSAPNFEFKVPQDIDWQSIYPFIAIVATGILALMIQMLKLKNRSQAIVWTSVFGLSLTAIFIVTQFPLPDAATLNGMLIRDRFGLVMELLLVLACFLCVLFSEGYLKEKHINFGEFFPLILWSTSGAMLMVTSKNLLVIFLGLEILSIALYVMAGMSRREAKSEESALKYFLLGAFASAFFLYGIAFFYGATGGLDLGALRLTRTMHDPTTMRLALIGIGLMLIGLGFKSAFVPFHQWTPDVYQGAPTNVTAFMAAGSKIAALATLFRVLHEATTYTSYLIPILFWIAILTMTVGNLIALSQKDVKRILGYSSIAHAGYLLVAILAHAKMPDFIGFGTMAYYLLSYTLMTVGAFAVVSLVAKDGQEGTRLRDLNGLWKRSPFAAGTLLVFMASLIGIPFTAGFAGKLMIFRDAMTAGLAPLAIVLAINSIISVAYYLSIGMAVFVSEEEPEHEPSKMSPGIIGTCAICAIGVLAVFVAVGPLLDWMK